MEINFENDYELENSGFAYAMKQISGKHTILYIIYELKSARYSKISETIIDIADKTLSDNLRQFQDDDLLNANNIIKSG